MLPNCWEIKSCGRQAGGIKVADLGECVASKLALGRSCWSIAGTLCGGVVQGTVAQKEKNCMACDVYRDYNRMTGRKLNELLALHADEHSRYTKNLKTRMQAAR